MADALIYMTLTRADGSQSLFTQDIAGANAEVWLETSDLNFETDRDKYFSAIRLELEGEPESLFLEYCVRDTLRQPKEWSQKIKIANVVEPIYIRETAKWIRLRLTDTLPNQRWLLHDVKFYGRIMKGRL